MEYLGVEEVAEPDETSHKGYGRHQTVECPQRGLVGCVAVESDDAENHSYGASVACESTFPESYDLFGMGAVVVPFIEETVAETGADYGAGRHPYQQ